MASVLESDARGITIALTYTRVSTDEQARDGLSLDTQLADCRRYVVRRDGWVFGREFQDVLTGKRDDRPDYQALLAEVRRLSAEGHRAAVVVARLDRFGRRVLERVRCREELKAPVRCRFAINAPKLDAQALAQVAAVLDVLGDGDLALSRALTRAWRAFERPALDDDRRRPLEQAAAKSRERIKRLALLFADGDLDREGYDLGRQQAQADLEAAEAALTELGARGPAVPLPPLESALASLGGWRGALAGGDLAPQRDVLGLLVERLEAVRQGYGRFELRMVWSPFGQALAQYRGLAVEAA